MNRKGKFLNQRCFCRNLKMFYGFKSYVFECCSTSFHSLCCLMNRKGKSLKKQCFYQNNTMFSGINSYNSVRMLSLGIRTAPQSFCHLFFCPVDDTFFEVSPEIRCPGVSNRYCCYGNHTARSKPI